MFLALIFSVHIKQKFKIFIVFFVMCLKTACYIAKNF